MADKETRLSIVIRTVDKATASIRAFKARMANALGGVRERINTAAAPLRAFGASLANLAGELGVTKLLAGFKAIGGVIGGVLSKVPLVGGVIVGTVGAAVAGLMSLVNHYDELGDKAEEVGVSVDFLAQMRFAAEKSGASIEQLDGGMKGFVSSLGQARAGTGRMAAFLGKVSPALLSQLKAAKSNEEAFGLLASAMDKIEDPAKRAALAQKVLGDASLAPLLNRGAKGIQELRDEYFKYAGSQQRATEEAGKVDDAMKNLKASTDGIKSALVVGLAPALKIVVDRLRDWFVGHRDDVTKWAKELGEKLPGAIQKVASAIGTAIDQLKAFFSKLAEIVDMADTLINGPKELEGMTLDEIKSGDFAGRRLKNQLKGTENLSNRDKVARSLQLDREAADLTSGDADLGTGFSERDENIAKAKRAAAQKLREQVGPDVGSLLRSIQSRPFGSSDAGEDISSVATAAREALAAVARSSTRESKVKLAIDLNNAPPGTRVRTDPQSTTDIDLNVGYQMLWGS